MELTETTDHDIKLLSSYSRSCEIIMISKSFSISSLLFSIKSAKSSENYIGIGNLSSTRLKFVRSPNLTSGGLSLLLEEAKY